MFNNYKQILSERTATFCRRDNCFSNSNLFSGQYGETQYQSNFTKIHSTPPLPPPVVPCWPLYWTLWMASTWPETVPTVWQTWLPQSTGWSRLLSTPSLSGQNLATQILSISLRLVVVSKLRTFILITTKIRISFKIWSKNYLNCLWNMQSWCCQDTGVKSFVPKTFIELKFSSKYNILQRRLYELKFTCS